MKTIINLIILLITAQILSSCERKEQLTVVENTKVVNVKLSKVKAQSRTETVSASGKIAATNNANLSTRMMGYITKISVNVGDKVKKGQLLLSINNTDLLAKRAQVNASIAQAKFGFKNAEKDYNRFKKLYEQKSATQKEMDDMTTHYEMAKAGLEAAMQMKNEVGAQFTYTNIKAPFSGVVTNKFVNEGDMTNPGMPLIAIETLKKFVVNTMIPESDITKIQSGSQVKVYIKSIHKTITGLVSEVSISAKNTGGQYLVKIALAESEESVLAGMFATVDFPVVGKFSTKILVPKSAIVENGSLRGIYTVSEQNTAVLRWIRIGKSYEDQVEVLSGLQTGDQYISSADAKLYNRVKVIVQ